MPACPSCHAEVDAEAELCLSCGEPLGAQRAAITTPAAPASPPATEPAKVRAPAPSSARETMIGTNAARRRRQDEPEAVRCPGCGAPSRAARCPGCGAILRKDD